MKSVRTMALAGLLAIGLAAPLANLQADETSPVGAQVKGKISSVDKSAQTVTINSQTYQVLPTTQIKKNNQPAAFTDIAVGQHLNAQYKKSTEGKMELLTAEIGGQGVASTDDATTEAQAFTGRVSKVDASAGTFTVRGQNYQVLATSKLMRGQKPASINDVKPGEQVTGQYKMSSENKMEVLFADIGSRSTPAVGGTQDRTTTEAGAGASFSGRVTQMNPAAQTFMIGNKTYQLLPTTTIATQQGATATVADLKNNERVSGTYKKSAEGKLEVTSLHIDAK